MNRIAEAKAHLPLPELLSRYGFGDRARKSARCPFHDDKRNSFSVWCADGTGRWAWKCHAGCGGGDEITFLEVQEELSRRDAVRRFLELAGVRSQAAHARGPQAAATFDWRKCVSGFTDKHVAQLAEWRGFSPESIRELREHRHIGIHNGLIAFPVHNNGLIVGTHFRLKDGTWQYFPTGTKASPLVFGELIPGERLNVFESTWDGLDYMDKSGERAGIIITRGAGNAKRAAALIPEGSTAYLWTQNDKAGTMWQQDFVEASTCRIRRVQIPAHDLNDWTRNGATTDDLLAAVANAETIREQPLSADDDVSPARESLAPPASFDDFYAYMPMHAYIFIPARDLWPAASVDARLHSRQRDQKGRPSTRVKVGGDWPWWNFRGFW
jgi:CHC2 zinc finger